MTPAEYLQREENDKEALKDWLQEIKSFAINQKAREFMVMLDAILRMKAREAQTFFLIDNARTKEVHVAYLQGIKVTTDLIKTVLKEEEKEDA